jgi:hypothetical protein
LTVAYGSSLINTDPVGNDADIVRVLPFLSAAAVPVEDEIVILK